MIKIFKKPFAWAVTFSILLGLFTSYVMLDTFVIPRTLSSDSSSSDMSLASSAYSSAAETETSSTESSEAAAYSEVSSSEKTVTDTSYSDGNISISISTITEYSTKVYVADIQVSSVEYLKSAFAKATYGRNITETTSDIAEDNNAIFAINGDYYGFRNDGYVIRNGIIYRSKSGGYQDLVIYSDGTIESIEEDDITAQELIDKGAWQVFSFGPALVEDSQVSVSINQEVDRAKTSNPRTAVGMISPLHYIIIVSDGRTTESQGLTLYQLAELFQNYGCTEAYNLDGGGSSTMYFNGRVINNPTDGQSDSERKVSDIVYLS